MIKEISILGISYQIHEVESVSKTESLMGQIDFIKQCIFIDKSLSKERKEEVLLHEIIHGIAEATGLDEKWDEQEIKVFSRTLYCLLKEQTTLYL